MSNSRFTSTQEITSKEIVDRMKESLVFLSTNQLQRLEHIIHVELLERDNSYYNSMKNEPKEDGSFEL